MVGLLRVLGFDFVGGVCFLGGFDFSLFGLCIWEFWVCGVGFGCLMFWSLGGFSCMLQFARVCRHVCVAW